MDGPELQAEAEAHLAAELRASAQAAEEANKFTTRAAYEAARDRADMAFVRSLEPPPYLGYPSPPQSPC